MVQSTAMVDVSGAGSSLVNLVEDGGLAYGIPIFLLATCMWVFGERVLSLTMGVFGFVSGYLVGNQNFGKENIRDLVLESGVTIPPEAPAFLFEIRFICAVIVGSAAAGIGGARNRRLFAFAIVFLTVNLIIQIGYATGLDFEADPLLSVLLTIWAFFGGLALRGIMPTLLSSVIGSLGILAGISISMGWGLQRFSDADPLLMGLGGVLSIASLFIQYKFKSEDEEDEMSAEEEKAYIF